MTAEEAILMLDRIMYDEDNHGINWATGAKEAFDMAISALEKQIPMKPKPKELAVEQPFKNHTVYIRPCGNCGEGLNFLHLFCPWCGQALDNTEGER